MTFLPHDRVRLISEPAMTGDVWRVDGIANTVDVVFDGQNTPSKCSPFDVEHIDAMNPLNNDAAQRRWIELLKADHSLLCDECDAPITVNPYAGRTHVPTYVHVGVVVAYEAVDSHTASPACTCEHSVTNPYCRQHGHEDVMSGAYDIRPAVRRTVDLSLRGWDER